MQYSVVAETSTNQVRIMNKNLLSAIFFCSDLSDLSNMSINMTEHSEFSELSELFESLSEVFDSDDHNSDENQATSARHLTRSFTRHQYTHCQTSDQKLNLVFEVLRQNN